LANTINNLNARRTININYPIYTGNVGFNDAINESLIVSLNKSLGQSIPSTGLYKTSNDCPVIAYPKDFGELSIKDKNGFEQSWDKFEKTFTIGKNNVTK
jgi:hypothetical protein